MHIYLVVVARARHPYPAKRDCKKWLHALTRLLRYVFNVNLYRNMYSNIKQSLRILERHLHDVWAWYLTWKICVLFMWTLDCCRWNDDDDDAVESRTLCRARRETKKQSVCAAVWRFDFVWISFFFLFVRRLAIKNSRYYYYYLM